MGYLSKLIWPFPKVYETELAFIAVYYGPDFVDDSVQQGAATAAGRFAKP